MGSYSRNCHSRASFARIFLHSCTIQPIHAGQRAHVQRGVLCTSCNQDLCCYPKDHPSSLIIHHCHDCSLDWVDDGVHSHVQCKSLCELRDDAWCCWPRYHNRLTHRCEECIVEQPPPAEEPLDTCLPTIEPGYPTYDSLYELDQEKPLMSKGCLINENSAAFGILRPKGDRRSQDAAIATEPQKTGLSRSSDYSRQAGQQLHAQCQSACVTCAQSVCCYPRDHQSAHGVHL